MKLERFVAGYKIDIRTFGKLRGAGFFVLLDRLAIGLVACSEVKAQMEPVWYMQSLIQIDP